MLYVKLEMYIGDENWKLLPQDLCSLVSSNALASMSATELEFHSS